MTEQLSHLIVMSMDRSRHGTLTSLRLFAKLGIDKTCPLSYLVRFQFPN